MLGPHQASERQSAHIGWLQRLSWIPVSVIIVATFMSAIWVSDRKPPFVVKTSVVVPPSVPGGPLLVEGDVERDIGRDCNLETHHWIEDSRGYRHYLPEVIIPSESIRRLEESISPGRTKFSAQIPSTISLGKAIYHAENRYVCNPMHVVWPISVITRIPFEVVKHE